MGGKQVDSFQLLSPEDMAACEAKIKELKARKELIEQSIANLKLLMKRGHWAGSRMLKDDSAPQ